MAHSSATRSLLGLARGFRHLNSADPLTVGGPWNELIEQSS
jgi:hypothetical protein